MAQSNRSVRDEQKEQSPFRIAERCLYNYQPNLARIETLRQRLTLLEDTSSVKVQNYKMRFSGGEPSCPVAERTEKIDSLERQIANLEALTAPITRMMQDWNMEYGLDSSQNRDLLQLLRLRYLAGGTWPEIAEKLNTSVTALKRWRQTLVNRAIDYLCL